MTACDDCLRRADLIAAVAGRLEIEFKKRTAPGRVLALPDEVLLEIGASHAVAERYASFNAPAAREPGVGGAAGAGVPLPLRVSGAPARPRRPARRAPCARRPQRTGRPGRRGRRGRAPGIVVRARRGPRHRPRTVSGARDRRLGPRTRDRFGRPRRRARGERPDDRRAGRERPRRVSGARAPPARGRRRPRRRGLGDAAGSERVPLVLRRPQPDHRRPGRGDRGRPGHGEVRLTDHSRLRERGRPRGRRRARPGHEPPLRRHAHADPDRRATDPRHDRCARLAGRRDRPRLHHTRTRAPRTSPHRSTACSKRSRTAPAPLASSPRRPTRPERRLPASANWSAAG